MSTSHFTFEELQAIVATLRSEHGCPWDKAQSHVSVRPYIMEEAYEVNQAITDLDNTGDPTNLIEELGDLMFQILLQAQIGEERGEFSTADVIDCISRKMIHRHPHVFGNKEYDSVDQQQADWEVLKAEEGGHRSEDARTELDTVCDAFPALLRGQKIAKKGARHNLFSMDEEEIFQSMLESVVDLAMTVAKATGDEHLNPIESELQTKLGKTLFAVCRFAEKHHLSAEMALNDEIEDIKEHC